MTICLIPESIDCFVLMKYLFVSILIFAYLMCIFIFEVAIHLAFPFKYFTISHSFLKAEARSIILFSFMCCFLLLSTELLSLCILMEFYLT